MQIDWWAKLALLNECIVIRLAAIDSIGHARKPATAVQLDHNKWQFEVSNAAWLGRGTCGAKIATGKLT
jgi:hypothetical protein